MENQDLSKRIITQGWVTSLYGMVLMTFLIIVLFTIGSAWDLILAQSCMSIFCSLTGLFARRAARFPSNLSASRYSSWAFMNLIIWMGAGAFSTAIQVLYLVFINASPAAFVCILLIWFGIYISGLVLFFMFLKIARLNLNSVASQQFQNREGAFAPGYGMGQPVGGFPAQGGNYYPPAGGVFYGQPIGNPGPAGNSSPYVNQGNGVYGNQAGNPGNSSPYVNPGNGVYGNQAGNPVYGNQAGNPVYGNQPGPGENPRT